MFSAGLVDFALSFLGLRVFVCSRLRANVAGPVVPFLVWAKALWDGFERGLLEVRGASCKVSCNRIRLFRASMKPASFSKLAYSFYRPLSWNPLVKKKSPPCDVGLFLTTSDRKHKTQLPKTELTNNPKEPCRHVPRPSYDD